MSPKSLHLPNGHRTGSDHIRHVKVYPARSPSLECVCVEIYEDDGLIYEGLVDLNRVVTAGADETALPALSQGRFELLELP